MFDYEDYSEKNLEKIKKNLEEEGFDLKYYLREENIEKSPYSPFDVQKILIEKKDGNLVQLEKASTIVNSITKGEVKREGTIFFPKM